MIEPTPSSVPPPTVPPRAHAIDAKERKRAAASVEKAPGTGTLSVRVRPWAEVFVDGRAIGVSPIAPLELGTGRHRVLLRNKDLGKERTVTADVSRGETTTLRVDLFE